METQNNFAIGSIPKHIMSIAGPMIVAQLINVLINKKDGLINKQIKLMSYLGKVSFYFV